MRKKKTKAKLTKIDYIIIAIVVCLLGVLIFSISTDKNNNAEKPTSLKDLEHGKIGVITGSTFETYVKNYMPEAKPYYYNNYADMVAGVNNNVIDGFLIEEVLANLQQRKNVNIDFLDETLYVVEAAVAIKPDQEGEELRVDFNKFLNEMKEDGTLEQLTNDWTQNSATKEPFDYKTLKGTRTIKLATSAILEPFEFHKDGLVTGLSIDLIEKYCMDRGYALEVEDIEFGGIVAALASGKYDMATASITPTEERKKSIKFSDIYLRNNIVMAIKGDDVTDEKSFLETIKDSLYRNFIEENRYELIIDGILTTLEITIFSAILGTLLAFGICIFRRSDSTLADTICKGYVKLFQGTPIIVVLMVFFYVVFSKSKISGVVVAIIAFSLNEAAYISEMMRSGIESVDKGQREAALTLGFSERQAFYNYIFPQAISKIIPVYKGEIIALLKGTSVVGYIAVQDLTKMGDIIRSRTYEAFFPLIVIAIIYFLLSWILARFIEILTDALLKK